MQAKMSEAMIRIGRNTSSPTDEFTDPQTRTTYTLIDFNLDWTPTDFVDEARACGYAITQRDADKILDKYAGVIVAYAPETNEARVWLFRTPNDLEQMWVEIESDAMRHVARARSLASWTE